MSCSRVWPLVQSTRFPMDELTGLYKQADVTSKALVLGMFVLGRQLDITDLGLASVVSPRAFALHLDGC